MTTAAVIWFYKQNDANMKIRNLFRKFRGHRHHYAPSFAQQATYLQQAADALCRMTETMDHSEWKRLEKEVKACEVQGDALLNEFYEQLYEKVITSIRRADLQTIALNIDELLDHINDSAKSILLYLPQRIDPQLRDLAQYIRAEADAIKSIASLLGDLRHNFSQISLGCDRITELEHAADDSYEEYIGCIFTQEKNAIELMKYKNIAETLEAATDAGKTVSDNIRKIILRYVE